MVIVGHSQGSFVLRELLANEVDPKPAVRRRLISALLLGGNVLVKKGRDAGGDFKRIPACRARTQTGCVIAFSTFNAQPPATARFGRTEEAGQEVLCTNPAALGGGSAKITPIQPTRPVRSGDDDRGRDQPAGGACSPNVPTAWDSYPNATARAAPPTGGADALIDQPARGAPVFTPSPDPGWGLHLVDANIALGDLVDLVRTQAAAWRRAHR